LTRPAGSGYADAQPRGTAASPSPPTMTPSMPDASAQSGAYPSSTRLEAFSDGVIAIIITIMVLELKVPHGDTPDAVLALWPTFLSYALSFFLVAIYWVNHHQLFSRVERVSHDILWGNNLLLFCISLIPFVTAYVGDNHLSAFPVALYSGVMFVCGVAFLILAKIIVRSAPDDVELVALDRRAARKNMIALAIYAFGVVVAYIHPAATLVCIAAVAVMYFRPTRWLE
jgi:uncharacterized membrane protein